MRGHLLESVVDEHLSIMRDLEENGSAIGSRFDCPSSESRTSSVHDLINFP
jgi:hypothetical protein